MMVIGSLLLPNPPKPTGPAGAAGWTAAGWAADCVCVAASLGSCARATLASAGSASARLGRLRALGIGSQDGVHVVEQVDALRRHLHLHALGPDVHVAARDLDRARRGDEVARPIVRGSLGTQLDVVEPDDDRAGQDDGRQLVLAGKNEVSLVARHHGLQDAGARVDDTLRLASDDGTF